MAVGLTIVIEDGKDLSADLTLNMADGFDLADYDSAAVQLEPLIQNMITGRIRAMTLNIPVALPQPRPLADPASDVEEGALFLWETADPRVVPRNRIATFDEALLVPGSRDVDLTNAAVIAWFTAISDGLTTPGGDVEFTDYRDQDILGLATAYELFQKSRKRR